MSQKPGQSAPTSPNGQAGGINFVDQEPKETLEEQSTRDSDAPDLAEKCKATQVESERSASRMSCSGYDRSAVNAKKSAPKEQQGPAAGNPLSYIIPWCPNHLNTVYTRYEVCVQPPPYVVEVFDKGAFVGKAQFAVQLEIKAYPNESSFLEELSMTPMQLDASLKEITYEWEVECKAACKNSKVIWHHGTPHWTVGDGHSVQALIQHSWTGNSNPSSSDKIALKWISRSTIPNTSPSEESGTDANTDVRCDNIIGSGPSRVNQGCVFYNYRPTFTVDPVLYPAARLAYLWAQSRWGYGSESRKQPLHRDADNSTDNRRRMCDGTFMAHPDTPDTSCEEFPFAVTKESGDGRTAASGSQCSQYYAFSWPEGPAGWALAGDGRYDYSGAPKKCLRANIPLTQNSGVGGDLGRFTQEVRLMKGDAYYLNTGTLEELKKSIITGPTPGSGNYTDPSELHNMNSFLCLGISGGDTNRGAWAIQWDCNGNADQKWTFSHAPLSRDNRISTTKTGMCLAIPNGSTEAGKEVIQWPCINGAAEQLWTVTPLPDKGWQIKNKNSQQCLAIKNADKRRGAVAIQWPCGSNPDHLWS
ncbi:RICIN domain-containing protein [Kitasatospora sp. NPDC089797]|uniref:RICIN domain-containing protein n=1 Tax=Kitasatospora sp. NPDC089797 TaxID=3155298 RepID=UPI00342129FB